jgi:hypothetical protein
MLVRSSRAISCVSSKWPTFQGPTLSSSSGYHTALDPNPPIYIPSPSPWAQANEKLVGRVMGLFGLVFSLDLCISALFQQVRYRVQGPTEFHTLVRVKVSGMKPDPNSPLYRPAHASRCFAQYTSVAEVWTLLRLKSALCQPLNSLGGPCLCGSYIPYA